VRLPRTALLLPALLPSLARADTPFNYLSAASPSASEIARLLFLLGAVSIVVVVVIAMLLVSSIFHRRPPDPTHGKPQRDEGGMGWIYWGVSISAVVLAVCMGWNLKVIADVVKPPSRPALTVEVTAHQWWWELRYMDQQPSHIFLGANEIHIPVGQPVDFKLASDDVIHSFWVPKLAGKMDIIPGQTNEVWIEALQPGVYRGECAVFCGTEHARMAFLVIADAPADFQAWRERQLDPAPAPENAVDRLGEQVFTGRCAACHTLRGSPAAGLIGPDLTHLMGRQTLAAGALPNTPDDLGNWIRDPQRYKPGTRMPAMALTDQDLAALTAYLETTH
jgi:cytochrome c oxidase subunit 2